jgi:hypothetical protein
VPAHHQRLGQLFVVSCKTKCECGPHAKIYQAS